jgi:hypothetical protein
MAYTETSIIMRVLKCTMDMHMLYIVKLFRSSLLIFMSDLKLLVKVLTAVGAAVLYQYTCSFLLAKAMWLQKVASSML